jgi:large subunit ribosomal protein L14e
VDEIMKRMQSFCISQEDIKMMDIGRVCVKTAGRDAGLKCVIVDKLDDNFVMIDGATRRRKCNLRHLEPTQDMLSLKKGAAHADIAKEFKKLGLEVFTSKPRPKTNKPLQVRAAQRKAASSAEEKPAAKPAKSEKAPAKAAPKVEKKE